MASITLSLGRFHGERAGEKGTNPQVDQKRVSQGDCFYDALPTHENADD